MEISLPKKVMISLGKQDPREKLSSDYIVCFEFVLFKLWMRISPPQLQNITIPGGIYGIFVKVAFLGTLPKMSGLQAFGG